MDETAEALSKGMERRKQDADAVERVRRYITGKHDRSYIPKTHSQEFKELVQRAIGNWLPLVVDTLSQNLFVEGYRRATDRENVSAWEHWTRNGLESRQALVYRSAYTYGMAYAAVLPGDLGPVVRVHSPLVMTVVQDDPDAEWPDYAVRRVRREVRTEEDKGYIWELIDSQGVWVYYVADDAEGPEDYEIISAEAHGLDVCPVVVFRNKWSDDPDIKITQLGEVEPLIPIQDQINDTTLGLLIAQQYSAFRQKWATGVDIPVDPATGKPLETFQAAVNRMWITKNPNVKFGEFSETNLGGYLESRESGIKHMAAIAQVPPHYLLGGMVNISAEALAAAEAGLSRKVNERKSIFGEAWARVFRLLAALSGDTAGAEDTEARVIWRDTEARSMAATADALGKMAQSLQIPVEGLWPMIPGVTPPQIAEWREMRQRDPMSDAAHIAASLISGNDRSLPVGTPADDGALAEAA